MRRHYGLALNAVKYLAVLAVVFVCNAIGNRLTYTSSSASFTSTLGVVFGLAVIQGALSSSMYLLSNGLVRDQLGKVGTHDILTSAFHFHPLWLVSRSGDTLRMKVIELGLGAFSTVLNRFTYFGPMLVGLAAAIFALGTLNAPLAAALVVVLGSMELSFLAPRKEKADAQRRAAGAARMRYAVCEKLDFARLSSARSRGPREYGAVVQRIVAYRQFYARSTYNADWAGAISLSIASFCNEMVSLAVLWLVLVTLTPGGPQQGEAAVPAASASPSTWLTWLAGRASSAPVATLSAFIVAIRAVTSRLGDVLTHRKCSADELRQYSVAADILTTAFLAEDVAQEAGVAAPAGIETASGRVVAALGDRTAPIPITITTPGGAITTINAGGVRGVVIKPFELRPGDITFVRGVNGSGKSLLMKALCGKFDASTRDGAKSGKLRSTGFANAFLPASIKTAAGAAIADRDDSTLAALSLTGCVAELSQSLDSFNLGEKGAATLGDVMLRVNGLLADPASDSYEPAKQFTPEEVGAAMVAALDAAGLTPRIVRPAFGGVVPALTQAVLTKACAFALKGLSGGEQQRLRLASLFLLERLRYDVWRRGDAIPHIEAQPVRVLLLDEPDLHIDIAFPSVFASLMRTLHPEHLQMLAAVVVMHSPLDVAGVAEAAQPPVYSPRLGIIELAEKPLADASVSADARAAVEGAWAALEASSAATASAKAPDASAPRSVFVAEYRPL